MGFIKDTWSYGIVLLLCCSATFSNVMASPLSVYSPPQTITVRMLRLINPTGASFVPEVSCVMNDDAYGCIALEYPGYYPFGGVNPITVQIEGIPANDRYLRDVVAQEMSPSIFGLTALKAQAIAARTYAYWHIRQGGEINNSNGFQVFLPYRHDQFSASERTLLDVALQDRHYMSDALDDLPIFSEFSSDAYLQTIAHQTQPWMKSAPDPISYDPAILTIIANTNAHQRGMSQNGASRWARGSSSYHPDAGTPWSVQWDNNKQVLAHYYTKIHVRDANSPSQVLTPQYRWVPLQSSRSVINGPIPVCSGGPNAISVWLQNSGTLDWSPQSHFDLGVKTSPWAISASASTMQGMSQPVNAGGSITETITIYPPVGVGSGPYTLSLDMYYMPTGSPDYLEWFSNREPSPRIWPTLDLQVEVVGSCRYSYLPGLYSNAVTQ